MKETTLPLSTLRLPLHGLRSRLLLWGFEHSYPLYARLYRRPRPAWQLSQESLSSYPGGSLGHRLGQFLEVNRLQLLPGFESHDVAHVLLAYQTTAVEEVYLQWCLLGNGKRSPYCLFAAGMGALCFPEHWGALRVAWRRGRSLRPFHHWHFEYLLREDLGVLQAFLQGKTTAEEVADY
jgi:hypothetical protein